MNSTRSKRGRKPCLREGCTGKRNQGHAFCSQLCESIDDELAKVQRTCEAVGGDTSTELWVAAVALSDARTELARLEYQMCKSAMAVGITREQWNAIRLGTVSQAATA